MTQGRNYAIIPSDWNGIDYETHMICVPASREWRIAIRNAVRMITRGRYWDRETGTITDAQAIGWEIYRSMTTCTEITELLTDIKTILQGLQLNVQTQLPCCDYLTAPGTPDPGYSVGEGDPPPSYGGTDITTWDEYTAMLCGAGHAWVTNMVSLLSQLADQVDENLFIIGGIATLLAALAAAPFGLLLAIDYGLATTIFSALVDLVSRVTIDAATDFLADNENRIANIIFCAGDAETAYNDLHTFLSENMPALSWALVSLFPIADAINVIYAGYNSEGEPLVVTPSEACDCTTPCNDCLFDIVGTIVRTGNVWVDDMAHSQYNVTTDGEYFYFNDVGGGYNNGRMWFTDLASIECAYCIEITILVARPTDRKLGAAYSENVALDVTEIDPSYVVTVPAYETGVFMVPISNPDASQSGARLQLFGETSVNGALIHQLVLKWKV